MQGVERELPVVFVEDAVKQLLKNSTRLLVLATLVLVSACAKETSTGGLQNSPPDVNGGSLDPNSPLFDARLPALLAKSVEITPANATLFLSQISEMFRTVPNTTLVESAVVIELNDWTSTTPVGNILVGIEEGTMFLGGLLPSVTEPVNTQSVNDLDMTFSDNELAVRVYASRFGDSLVGDIYYRVRGSETTCFKKTYTCKQTINGVTTTVDNSYCSDIPGLQAADLAACKSYMNLSSASVKKLGTFQTDYSNWAN